MHEAKGGADQKQEGYFVETLCVRRSVRVFGSTLLLFIAGAMLTLHELELQQAAATAARRESGAVQVELFNHTVRHFRQAAELRARLLRVLRDNRRHGEEAGRRAEELEKAIASLTGANRRARHAMRAFLGELEDASNQYLHAGDAQQRWLHDHVSAFRKKLDKLAVGIHRDSARVEEMHIANERLHAFFGQKLHDQTTRTLDKLAMLAETEAHDRDAELRMMKESGYRRFVAALAANDPTQARPSAAEREVADSLLQFKVFLLSLPRIVEPSMLGSRQLEQARGLLAQARANQSGRGGGVPAAEAANPVRDELEQRIRSLAGSERLDAVMREHPDLSMAQAFELVVHAAEFMPERAALLQQLDAWEAGEGLSDTAMLLAVHRAIAPAQGAFDFALAARPPVQVALARVMEAAPLPPLAGPQEQGDDPHPSRLRHGRRGQTGKTTKKSQHRRRRKHMRGDSVGRRHAHKQQRRHHHKPKKTKPHTDAVGLGLGFGQ